MTPREKIFIESRKKAAKEQLVRLITDLELNLTRMKAALEENQEPYTSFAQHVPTLVEKATKVAVYGELLEMFGND